MDPERPLPSVDCSWSCYKATATAAVTNEHDGLVCTTAAAMNEVNDQSGAMAVTSVKDWPSLATLRTPDGHTFALWSPARTFDASPQAPVLPTYVRQIHRRMAVHSRVGLVHASRARRTAS